MEKIEAKFRIVTPMFMSGADQTKAELRVPSIKGALRFWWRALALGWYGDVNCVKKEEESLFGSTEEGQSKVMIYKGDSNLEIEEVKNFRSQWKKYAGYGLTENKPKKEFLSAGGTFTLELLFREDTEKMLLPTAFKTLGLLGGVGGRSRKGWGSLTLEKLEGDEISWSAPRSISEYKKEISGIISDYSSSKDIPPYTAFSKHTKIHVGDVKTSSESAHKYLGKKYKESIKQSDKKNRKYFGLPRKKGDSRRASPLFLHVQHLGDKSYLPVVSFINAKFEPGNEKIVTEPIQNFLKSVGGEIE